MRNKNLTEINGYIIKQLNNFFPERNEIIKKSLSYEIKTAYERSRNCFIKIKTKYYDDENILFNSDKYAVFLYFLSYELFLKKKYSIANKVYYLNKALNGVDLYYEIKMPDIFILIHPVGTVLGRAKYNNYFVVYQNCTVGSNRGFFPNIDERVTMRPGSSVLGKSDIKSNCEISINSTLMDLNLKKNSIYIGSPKNYLIKRKKSKGLWF